MIRAERILNKTVIAVTRLPNSGVHALTSVLLRLHQILLQRHQSAHRQKEKNASEELFDPSGFVPPRRRESEEKQSD